jgi:hypothetical protein
MNDHVERWRLRASEWLDAQQAADLLRETKNDVFAEIKSRQDGRSEAEKDRLARLSNDWKDHRNKMIEAEANARRLRLRMKYEEMMFDAWRTGEANKRRELAKY